MNKHILQIVKGSDDYYYVVYGDIANHDLKSLMAADETPELALEKFKKMFPEAYKQFRGL